MTVCALEIPYKCIMKSATKTCFKFNIEMHFIGLNDIPFILLTLSF